MSFINNRQKSPKRRFLLILGVTAFVCFVALGVMIIFWDSMLPNLDKTTRVIFGVIIIIYAAVRFSRIIRREKDEE
jgi:peptidoglycan/LPS O-acetylase OafA/YrhL